MATTHPIREKSRVRELAGYYRIRGELRNYVLIILAIGTALRISDLLRLRWEDVYDFKHKYARRSIEIVEKKTRKPKSIALNKSAVVAINVFASEAARQGGFLVENARTGNAISRIQAYRIIRAAAEAIEFDARVSCHSLRKTFGYHAYHSGASLAVIMEIYNHSSIAVTMRYLGITQDDKDAVYQGLDLTA